MPSGYGSYSYVIVVGENGDAKTTHTYADTRPIRKGEVLNIPFFGEVKITEIVEESGVGRAGRAHAERIQRR
jgi:hypothetical protein